MKNKPLSQQEILIKFLINKFNSSKTNVVSITPKNVEELGFGEAETVRLIYILQEDKFLTIKRNSVHNDFSMLWEVALTSKTIHYFENKQRRKKKKRNEWIQFWIPLITSTVMSIITLIISLIVQ